MDGPANPVFAFGPFRLDPGEQRLFRDGQTIPLTPKAFELLVCLVENPGRLLNKEDLLAEVWPGTFVEEAVLSVNMSAIRKALGDDAHTYIETVSRRGYRFVAPVVAIDPLAALSADVTSVSTTEAEPVPIEQAADPAPPVAVSAWPRGEARQRLALAAVLMAIVVLGSAVLGRFVWRGRSAQSSVAVLPLHSLSDDPAQDHFADAMTEMLITDLGRIPALRVVSRQSILQYKQSHKGLRDIARELKADYIAEGTVGRDGDRVRITAQLIDGATDRHVWAQSYERDLRDTFALQGDVADSIAREIGVKLSGGPAPRAAGRDVPAAAYEAYLRGNYLLDEGKTRPAIQEFRQAVALYPDFAAAYGRIANAYFGFGFFGGMAPKEAWVNMKDAALKAITLDDRLADGHAALAFAKMHYDWDWPGAEAEFRRSLELNPSDSDVRHMYAHFLLTVGKPEDSLGEMDRAFEIDPVGPGTAT